jgi:translocation and assembly module TamA
MRTCPESEGAPWTGEVLAPTGAGDPAACFAGGTCLALSQSVDSLRLCASCALLLLLASSTALLAVADPVKLEVEVEGLDGELRDNVRAHLSLLAMPEQERTAAKILALHRRAEEEIRAALEPFGYYRPEIVAGLDQGDDGKWIARYRVEAGPRLRVRTRRLEVEGEGRQDAALTAAVSGFPLEEGDPVDQPLYEEGKATLEEAAATNGYLDATFETAQIRVDLVDYHGDIVLVYDTGPRYYFGETRIQQSVVDPDIVEGYVPWKAGEPFDQDELLELQTELGASPYFRRAEVEPRREDAVDRRVPIDVRLVPAKPRLFRGGLGYGTDSGPRARGGFEWRRLNRRGHQASADVVVSGIERSLETLYRIPAPYPRTDVITFATGYRDDDTETARSQTGLVSGAFTRSLGTWRETFSLAYRREDFTVGLDSGVSDLLVPEVSFGKLKSDQSLYPSWGRRLDFSARGAAEGLLTDTSFLQLTARAKSIWSLQPRPSDPARDGATRLFSGLAGTRLIARAETGWTESDDFRALPASLRFFAGGDQSVRGYDLQDLGPRDEAGNVIGGEALVVASVELDRLFLDFDRFGRWGAAVFYDVGGAARDLGDSLESGAGAGIRWLSPIGLVRLDVAWAVSEPGAPVRFHIGVGPDF